AALCARPRGQVRYSAPGAPRQNNAPRLDSAPRHSRAAAVLGKTRGSSDCCQLRSCLQPSPRSERRQRDTRSPPAARVPGAAKRPPRHRAARCTRVVSIGKMAFGPLQARAGLQNIELAVVSQGYQSVCTICQPFANPLPGRVANIGILVGPDLSFVRPRMECAFFGLTKLEQFKLEQCNGTGRIEVAEH